MKLGAAIHTLALMLAWMFVGPVANAQVRGHASSATHVSAEMTKGRLNPSESKPGDRIALKLKEEVRSNGDVVLKKGAVIEGVVKTVKRAEGKTQGHAQSLLEIEWFTPAGGGATQQLSIALQSVAQVNPMHAMRDSEGQSNVWAGGGANAASTAGGGGLLGGVGSTVGGVAGATGSLSTGVDGTVGALAGSHTQASGTANVALMSMPSVVAADGQTTTSLQNTFGVSSSSQLFKVGRGEVVSAGGTKHSLDIFTHLANDTVITSPSRNFEISSGAQMQLLVGVKK
jgi:hypothetical protein